MKYARARFQAIAFALLAPLALSATGQMHKVAAPEKVTRAVGVYEYVGDLEHPKSARLIPVSLFIGGHFEDAGVYLARPIPFALAGGLRYELQRSGVRQDYLDVLVSRNFTSSAAAAATPFDDGWFGYGRVSPPAPPKAARLRPNCGNARVVQETDSSKKDDSKPHFGTKPADDDSKSAADNKSKSASSRTAGPDPCRDDDSDKPERVSLADERDKNALDPERPTLHRSPETTANNTGSNPKQDKKPNKPPPATITANGSPADDPDRPTIRHRPTDENDPNALPPDPIDLASHERTQALAKASEAGDSEAVPHAAAPAASVNDTVADNASISSGDTTTGRPMLHRGRPSTPAPDPTPATAAKPAASKSSSTTPTKSPATAKMTTVAVASTIAPPLDAIVAVSDAKDRAAHDYSYHFSSTTERATALDTLQTMARAVLANPALATDAPEGAAKSGAAPTTPAPAQKTAAHTATAAHTSTAAHTPAAAHSTAASRARAHTPATAPVAAATALADEQMSAYQLYFSAPVTYVYSARMPATATAPERFVTVIAQTDAEGKLVPSMRSVTDAVHLDRTPRYRLIDVVDADGSNRASLLMELRAQHTRQFALYRLLGNKPDQVFVSGSTLL